MWSITEREEKRVTESTAIRKKMMSTVQKGQQIIDQLALVTYGCAAY